MKCKITPDNIQSLSENEIFVFGSNLAGLHGAGAAKLAKDKFGAQYRVGHGMTGQCYAFPTKNNNLQTLHLSVVQVYVKLLKTTVQDTPDKHFLITQVGCGLAGYTPQQIAPLFEEFVNFSNVSLPQSFIDVINVQ